MIFFKIYNVKTAQYSKGGTMPRFSKMGKVWQRKGDVSNHLNLVHSYPHHANPDVYSDCVVLKYEITSDPYITLDGLAVPNHKLKMSISHLNDFSDSGKHLVPSVDCKMFLEFNVNNKIYERM